MGRPSADTRAIPACRSNRFVACADRGVHQSGLPEISMDGCQEDGCSVLNSWRRLHITQGCSTSVLAAFCASFRRVLLLCTSHHEAHRDRATPSVRAQNYGFRHSSRVALLTSRSSALNASAAALPQYSSHLPRTAQAPPRRPPAAARPGQGISR